MSALDRLKVRYYRFTTSHLGFIVSSSCRYTGAEPRNPQSLRRVYRGLTEQKMRSDTRTARLKRAPRFGVGLRSERRVLKLLDKLPPADEPWAPMITTGDGHGQRVSGSDGDGGGGVGDGGGGGGGGGSGGGGGGGLKRGCCNSNWSMCCPTVTPTVVSPRFLSTSVYSSDRLWGCAPLPSSSSRGVHSLPQVFGSTLLEPGSTS